MEKTGLGKIITAFLLVAFCFSLVIAANSTANQTSNQTTEDVNVTNITTEVEVTSEADVTLNETEDVNVTEEVVAEDTSNVDPILLASYKTVKCKTEFAIAIVGTIMASDSAAIDLVKYASALQADLVNLKEFVDNNDKEGYTSYLKETYEANVKAEQEAIGEWKETAFNTITLQSRSKVKGDYAVIESKYKMCLLDNIKIYGNGRLVSFNAILDSYDKKAKALAKEGVAVSSLNKILEDAQSQIIDPLESSLKSSNDAKSISKIVKDYCLFDGCQDGVNFHLSAKWEVAKLKLMLQRIKAESKDTEGLDTVIADLEMAIYTAESAMTYAGDSQFTGEQQKQVRDSIKDGYNIVKQVLKNK